ncbi:MAG TPA: galactokinase [Phycisphaerae bacterium]|nr:galactokinase [Phycisphaerae bacterium]
MAIDLDRLKDHFQTLNGRPAAGAVRAPGRVNLIGEHTDYNDGFVLPIAIERQTVAAYAPRADRVVSFTSLQAGPPARIELDPSIDRGEPAWANYCRGVAAGLIARGVALVGADVLFDSDVPVGGGLSSSAALEVVTALALLAAAGQSGAVPPRELAALCQTAEHEYALAPCGIMDQSIVVMAHAGCAMLLDCRSGRIEQVPLDSPGAVVLVADTQVRHDIADGGYAARREQCRQAAEALGVAALRDADEGMIARAASDGTLRGRHLMRARHVVGEIARTLAACDALKAGDHAAFGRLMYASHASLRNDYEVSCDELDAVVELARECAGVFGARMTGGGFGGCAIILAESARADEIRQAVSAGFERRFGRRCPVFATRAVGGASNI